MRRFSAALLCFVVLALSACSPPPSRYPYAAEVDPRSEEYVVGVADTLAIRVWGNADLTSEEAVVRPDGAFTLPLVGDVPAAGRKVSQIRTDVMKRLSAFIRDDTASVMVSVRSSAYRVTVTGNVAQPGIVESPAYLKASEALALAGGPNEFADPDDAIIIRIDPNGQVKRIPVQLDEVLEGRRLEQDIMMRRGDRLHVP